MFSVIIQCAQGWDKIRINHKIICRVRLHRTNSDLLYNYPIQEYLFAKHVEILVGFQPTLPTNPATYTNFFILSTFTFSGNNKLSIDRLTIVNNYDDDPLYIRTLRIKNGTNVMTIPLGDIQLSSGFGGDYNIPGFPLGLDSRFSTTIDITTQCIACVFDSSWKFHSAFTIPSYYEVRHE